MRSGGNTRTQCIAVWPTFESPMGAAFASVSSHNGRTKVEAEFAACHSPDDSQCP